MQITLGRAQGGLGFHDICSLYSTIKGELSQVVERLLNMRDVAGCPHSPGSFNFLVLCWGRHLQMRWWDRQTYQEVLMEIKDQVPPRFDLGSLDSESKVLTITPRNPTYINITSIKKNSFLYMHFATGLDKVWRINKLSRFAQLHLNSWKRRN